MTVYEKLKEMTLEEMILFLYVHGKNRGIKKTREFLTSEYEEEKI